MYKRLISIIVIFILLAAFAGFDFCRKSDKQVLNVINASEIQIDLNNNKIYDAGETVCIPDVSVFSGDISKNQDETAKIIGVSASDALKIGYLTDAFADGILASKRVKLKFTGEENQNCRYADIIINNASYRDMLVKSGFAAVDGKKGDNFSEVLSKARKLNLVILNHKSSKYHKLDCKYGLMAHDAVLILKNQLPKDAKPCNFCHTQKLNQADNTAVKNFVVSDGSIKMYLTDFTTKLKPDNKCSAPVCKEIVNQINQSTTSIDIATYGWDFPPDIKSAMEKAYSRGVKIRVVYDRTSFPDDLDSLLKLTLQKSTDNDKILMHNKFIIFDNARVITGSMNFSLTGLSGFNGNCVFLINSAEIALAYKKEFEQMLNGKFHNNKTKYPIKNVQLGKTKIAVYFSPKDKTVLTAVIPLVNSAQKYIYIPAFVFTHDELAQSLISAKKRGVDVKIIADAVNTTTKRSKIKLLRSANIPVKIENYAGKLHSKSIIIDDKYIISGSMNFSYSGENKNDENCLIIEDSSLAKYYRGFFEYIWDRIPDKYLKQYVRAESQNSIGSCSDGVDNNFDGKVDMLDEGCRK